MISALLTAVLLLPLLWLPVVALAARRSRRGAGLAAGAAMASGLGALAMLAPTVFGGQAIVASLPWLGEWGLDLALRLDGLGFLFALLIDGIGLLIIVYAYYYLPEDDGLGRFYGMLLAFAAGMLGIVLAENILLMAMAWEITSLASFLLIAYKFREKEARIGARMALAATGGGGLALMAGLILLGTMAGSFSLSDILVLGDSIRSDPRYPVMLILVLIGAFSKSAQFPFHFWLPTAMAAPTPASAYLHSATMVKAGVFLLARFYPVLSGTELWFVLVTTTGAITFILGAYRALTKNDFKGLLAYSTISHLGLITMLFGLGTALSPVAAVFHIINHAIFKASLFMVAGIVDHECGTRDMRRINGMWKFMPVTATLGILAAGAMAGVPFLNGFLSKEMFFAETLARPDLSAVGAWVLPIIATIGGVLSVGYSARFVHDVFFNGEPIDLPRTPHEPVRLMLLPVMVLVGIVLLVGLVPQFAVLPILSLASSAMLMEPAPAFKLAVWHGFNLPLVMSIAALGGGIYYYMRRETVFMVHARLAFGVPSPVAFERVYAGAVTVSRWIMAVVDLRSVRQDVSLFLGMILVIGVWAWLGSGATLLVGGIRQMPVDASALLAFTALLIGLGGTVALHRRPVAAVIFLSVVGLVTALVFVRFGGPDLALTQVSVEVASILVMLLALRFLPNRTAGETGWGRRWRDGVLAGATGVGAALLSFAMLTRPFETISGYHIAQSKPAGGGNNIVNVILVDFRGFDTMGEIAVLAMAALGVQALLAGLRLRPRLESEESAAQKNRAGDRLPIMLQMMIRPLLPLMLVVAAYVFVRGHDLPGGGFVAGLIITICLISQYVGGGATFAEARLRIDFTKAIGIGLALAAATGMASWAFGRALLTSGHVGIAIPLIGSTEIVSAMLFDLAILIVVMGALMVMLTSIGAIGERGSPPAAD